MWWCHNYNYNFDKFPQWMFNQSIFLKAWYYLKKVFWTMINFIYQFVDCLVACANGGTQDASCACSCDAPWTGDTCSGRWRSDSNQSWQCHHDQIKIDNNRIEIYKIEKWSRRYIHSKSPRIYQIDYSFFYRPFWKILIVILYTHIVVIGCN